MPLFELASEGTLTKVPATNFATEQVLERADLQRALRANISVLGPDLLVVAEEFGDFADVRRRIDLLCVDREGQLVVVELKAHRRWWPHRAPGPAIRSHGFDDDFRAVG